MSGRVLLSAGFAVLLLGACAFPAVAQAPRPQRLYQALLTTAVPEAQLPSGFTSPRTSLYQPSSLATKHHVVGGVEIDLDANGGDAGIVYLVFATRADAVADWKAADLRKHSKSTLPAPAGMPWPALLANRSVTGKSALGKTVTNGVTEVAFTWKNVIGQALTTSYSNTDSGDIPGAIRLSKFTLSYLKSVSARVH